MINYLVVLEWNDGTETTFIVRCETKEKAIQLVRTKAIAENGWPGHIIQARAEVLDIPARPNQPKHVYTEQKRYHSV